MGREAAPERTHPGLRGRVEGGSRQERRARELDQRRQVIIDAARELAEADGWESVTTRRLADRIEYSQPVLYSRLYGFCTGEPRPIRGHVHTDCRSGVPRVRLTKSAACGLCRVS
jgi:hypothetical protein